MGLVRTEKNRENTVATKQGRRGAFTAVRRYLGKLAAFSFATLIFGVIYTKTTQPILDMAWQGELAWGVALEQALIKSLQYGTMRWPDFLIDGVTTLSAGRPFTAFINYLLPFLVLFTANFYLVSFIVDLLDGREGEVFRYWVIAVVTLTWMTAVFAVMNGAYVLSGANVTFDSAAVKANIKTYGTADPPIGEPQALTGTNATAANATAGNQTATNTTTTTPTTTPGDTDTGGPSPLEVLPFL